MTVTEASQGSTDAGEQGIASAHPSDLAIGGSVAARTAAAGGGIAILFGSALITMGTSLFAPFGVLGARAIAKRRGGRLSRGAAWLGAVLASVIGVPLVVGFLLSKAPAGTVASIRSAMDSAQTQQKPTELPEWLERVSPPGAQQRNAATQEMLTSGPMVTIFAILGVVAFCTMSGTLAGSMGWAASMLIGYAITGRWIARGDPPRFAPLPDE